MTATMGRWVALGVGVFLTLGGAVLTVLVPPTSYQATAQMVVTLPSSPIADRGAVNPYLMRPDGMVVLARATVLSVRSEVSGQGLSRDGDTTVVRLDSDVTTPVVRFSVEGGTPSVVDANLTRVLGRFSDRVESIQREAGTPDHQIARATVFDTVRATPVSGDRGRAAMATVFLGMATTLMAVRLVRRKAEQARPAGGPGHRRDTASTFPLPRLPRSSTWRPLHRSLPPRRDAMRWTLPAVAFVIVYVGLLLLIPSRLGIAAIGGPGKPASLWALLAAVLWAVMVAIGAVRRPAERMRIAAGLLGTAALLSYITGHIVGWYQPADIHQRSDSRWRLVSLSELNEVMVSAADRGLLAVVGWLGVMLVTAEGMRSWKDLELLVTWVVRCAAVVAALGVFQYFTNVNVAALIQIPGLSTTVDFTTFTRSVLNRVVSTAGHPIELGVNMAAIFPLALHRSLHTRRPMAWIPTVLLGLMVLMSVSRAAVIALACAGALLFWGWPNRWRIRAIVILPFVALVARAALPGLLGTISALFLSLQSDPSVAGRTQDYPFFISAFSEDPLFGRGLYTWSTYYFRTLDNQVLMSLLEVGVVGVLAFAYLIVTAIVGGLRCRRLARDPRSRHLGLALASAVLAMTVSYFMFDTLGFNQAAGLAFLLFGMAGAAHRLAREEHDCEQPVITGERTLAVQPGTSPRGATR